MKYLFYLVLFMSPAYLEAQVIQGELVDENKEPLISALVLSIPDSNTTLTNSDGQFELQVSAVPIELQVYHLGYHTKSIYLDTLPDKVLHIQLSPKEAYLEMINVSEEHAKQEGSLPVIHLDEDYFKEQGEGTFAQQLNDIPGLSAMNVGTGIAKPVIRGLSGNRILVNNNGIKQEGQQWGNDHGLEIDPFNVERVEVVKGPATLQYGSDALGGVINIMPKRIPQKNSVSGSLTGIYKSNNNHLGSSAQLRANHQGFFLTARYSHQAFADFKVPADTFVYNDFVLPIINQTLKNTAGRETNLNLLGGYKNKNSITKLTYRKYALKAGFFSGAIGIPRSYTLQSDGNIRDVDVPYQEVTHEQWTLNQTINWGENHWVLNLGYQHNDREEHSYPEFHSIPSSQIDPNETLGLGLNLKTYSVNSHYEFHKDKSRWVVGLNGQIQDQRRSGFEYLLPDYKTYRMGIYGLNEWEIHSKWTLYSGVRLDYAHNDTKAHTQYIYDSNERIIDSLVSPLTDDHFINYAVAAGANYKIQEKWNLKFNVARSYRIPYPNETVSNGVHHGTFRHEIGQANLSSETGLQFDVNSFYRSENTQLQISTYVNYFQDYIYLRPSARFSSLPEAGQIFKYVQNDALFTGLELSLDQSILQFFKYGAHLEGLYSINLDEQQALPFTPPASILHSFAYNRMGNGLFLRTQLKIQHRYTFAQNRVDQNEKTTPSYHLFQFQANTTLDLKYFQARFDLKVMNVFNNTYLRHLSRYRLLNLPEQGRNVVIGLTIEF